MNKFKIFNNKILIIKIKNFNKKKFKNLIIIF